MSTTTAPIIVGVDDSDTSRRAAVKAAELATCLGAPLHLVMAVHRGRSAEVAAVGADTWQIDSVTTSGQFLETLIRELPCEQATHTVSLGEPAAALCEEADRLNAQMIVVGNRRVQGLTRLLGAVATDVVRRANCDVLVANTTSD
jgi:nucleotide-binding universal stress UspA family protein